VRGSIPASLFVTTKRGQGCSGLGLNIVFNLVNTKLGGTIALFDTKEGVHFKVKVPLA
jgi:C4-dicarboxylate-specific signal transduction histidine kinase